jgi:hypothetical protein
MFVSWLFSESVIVQPPYRAIYRMNTEWGAVGGMRIGKVNRSTRRKPTPILRCPHRSHMIRPSIEPGPLLGEALYRKQ